MFPRRNRASNSPSGLKSHSTSNLREGRLVDTKFVDITCAYLPRLADLTEKPVPRPETLPGEGARRYAARWMLTATVLFALVGVAFHFLNVGLEPGRVNWWYQFFTTGIGLSALVGLYWLRRSLTRAMLFFAWTAFCFIGGILVYDVLFRQSFVADTWLLSVAVFTVGLILGFRPAVQYATASTLLMLIVGVWQGVLAKMVLPSVLVFALALPSKVVERLIEESTEELETINQQLRAEIARRKQVERELRRYQEQLEALVKSRTAELETRNAELDAFAHTVAHDLKNPLAVILGYAETWQEYEKEGLLGAEHQEAVMGKIYMCARKMGDIIDGLLVLSGLREDKMVPEPLDMAAILESARLALENLVREHGAEVVLPARNEWPVVIGYAPWVEEIWINYISNAIKYGGRPPRVQVGFDVPDGDRGYARFWVRDNGRGLTPEEQERLFLPFTQLAQKVPGGHGLGLSIVHRITQRLGGEVGVQSQPGAGSLFYFTLPLTNQRPEKDSPRVLQEQA